MLFVSVADHSTLSLVCTLAGHNRTALIEGQFGGSDIGPRLMGAIQERMESLDYANSFWWGEGFMEQSL